MDCLEHFELGTARCLPRDDFFTHDRVLGPADPGCQQFH